MLYTSPRKFCNIYIDPKSFCCCYGSFIHTVCLIKQLRQGTHSTMYNLGDAFKHILVHPGNWAHLGCTWKAEQCDGLCRSTTWISFSPLAWEALQCFSLSTLTLSCILCRSLTSPTCCTIRMPTSPVVPYGHHSDRTILMSCLDLCFPQLHGQSKERHCLSHHQLLADRHRLYLPAGTHQPALPPRHHHQGLGSNQDLVQYHAGYPLPQWETPICLPGLQA